MRLMELFWAWDEVFSNSGGKLTQRRKGLIISFLAEVPSMK
jgi:hypothetical protein